MQSYSVSPRDERVIKDTDAHSCIDEILMNSKVVAIISFMEIDLRSYQAGGI